MNELTPKTCKPNQVYKLRKSVVNTKNSWLMAEGSTLLIANQKWGEKNTGTVRLSRREFERFIKFYETGK